MAPDHEGVIHLVDVVAGENHHILRVIEIDETDILVDGVGGALVPGLGLGLGVGRQHVGPAPVAVQVPGLAVADVVVELQGLVLGEYAHGVDAGVNAVGQREINDAVLAPKGNRRLGGVLGEHVQAAALAAGQEHGDALFFTLEQVELPLKI